MDGEGHKYGSWKLTKTYVIKFSILRVTTTPFYTTVTNNELTYDGDKIRLRR